jgi:Domain of Unknown Function (DUF1080)
MQSPQRMPIIAMLGVLALLAVAAAGYAFSPTRADDDVLPTPLIQFPDAPPTATIGSVPADIPLENAPAGLGGTVLLAEGFDSPDALQTWQFLDLTDPNRPDDQVANWIIQDGRLLQDYVGLARNLGTWETVALTGDTAWTDYTITAKVYDRQNVAMGLVARANGTNFYRYRAVPASLADGTITTHVLEKVVDGVATPLTSATDAGYTQREWHQVSMNVRGSTITVWLDGVLVLTAQDTSFPAGQAGLTTYAVGEIFFDDVTVTQP